MKAAELKDLMREAWLRQRERGLIIWTTRDGKEIPINEMSDSHLVNTINMLERNKARVEEEEEENWVDPIDMGFDPFWEQFMKD